MTGAFLSAALLALAALIWTAALRGFSPRAAVWAGALVPPLIVSACLVAAGMEHRFGQVRLTLEAVRFEQPGAALTIGGSDGDLGDDLHIPDAAPGVGRLRLSQGPDGAPVLALESLARDAGQATVSVLSVNGAFVGARPFGRGFAICLSRCEGDEAEWNVLSPDGALRFVAGRRGTDGLIAPVESAATEAPPLPVRQAFLGLPALRGWRAAQAAHPLRRHLASAPADTRSVLIQTGSAGPTLDPQAWLGRRWVLLVLDPEVWIAAPGETPRAVGPETSADLAAGDRMAVWDVRYGEPASGDQPAGRLQERRSFTVGPAGAPESGLDLMLDTPATLDVADCSRGGLIRREGDMAFPLLGGRLVDAMDLGLPSRCESLRSHAFNFDPEALGGVSPRLLLTTFAPPVGLIVAIVGFWAVVVCLAQGADWGARPTHWILYCVLQTLLALRLLTALGGVAADPDLTTSPIVGQALTAYVAVPALFLFLRPGPSGAHGWALGPMLLTAATVAAVLLIGGRLPDGLPLAAAMGVVVLGAAGLMLRPRLEAAASERDPDVAWSPSPGAWAKVLGLAVLGRLVLGLFSIKERIPGLGVAVSALYTPALIVGFAQLLATARGADGPRRLRLGLAFAGAVILTLVLVPLFIKDNGYAILALPISLTAAWAAFRNSPSEAAPSWRVRAIWAAPGAGLVLLLAGLLAGGALDLAIGDRPAEIAEAASAPDDAAALRLLETVADESNNRLRLWQRLAPERVEQSGAGEAENLRVISHHLTDYSSTLFGRGYLHPQRLGVLAPVQLSDNAAAVHLMGPFGRAGAWALLVLLALTPLACLRLNPEGAEGRTWPEIAGALALWVLFGVGAYMVLANLQLVPFTGRNLYLVAPASDSDLLEGATLIGMAYLGLVSRSAWPGWRAALAGLKGPRRFGGRAP